MLRVEAKRFLERSQRMFGPAEQIVEPGDRNPDQRDLSDSRRRRRAQFQPVLAFSRGDFGLGPFFAESLLVAAQAERIGERLDRAFGVATAQPADAKIAPAFEIPRVFGEDRFVNAGGLSGSPRRIAMSALSALGFEPRQGAQAQQFLSFVELVRPISTRASSSRGTGSARREPHRLAEMRRRLVELQPAGVKQADEQH